MTARPAFRTDYQRMWDLVRVQRHALLDANLITRDEYAELLAAETSSQPGTGSPSPRRLESYDEVRAKLEQAETTAAQLREAIRPLVEFAEHCRVHSASLLLTHKATAALEAVPAAMIHAPRAGKDA